ncbi:hypothetical protein EFA46_005285 [Halarchaeum sp. CBA1220]|uniref:hypothetical protein n=1 Tax=Halarchaeum sp. CBA1220 TaxID=1853682 RepID=UPI000F3AA7D8|nr:hypothetical protein [Halarchaeum sp. CBA1220]QLC33635.1 hypothetical protein EFA46_005285 [Halarchaeum sp. CBA1220]
MSETGISRDELDISFHDVGGSRWTFEDDPVREWTLSYCQGRVLNACAGQTKLGYLGEVVRNDLNEDATAETHLDVHDLPDEFGADAFDTIIFDPPWSGFQADDKYQGGDVNWTRALKEGFDTMLRPRGRVIQLGYSAANMPRDLGYRRDAVGVFAPYGRRKAFLGVVCEKRPQLSEFGASDFVAGGTRDE